MKLFKYIKRLVRPPICICCKRVLKIDTDDYFCKDCDNELKRRVVDSLRPISQDYVDACYSYYRYHNWYVKKLISLTKNMPSRHYMNHIGDIAKESLEKHNLLNQIDVITFAPRRNMQTYMYGFDQSKKIAKAISRSTNVPFETLLKRIGYSAPQKSLDRQKRIKNAKNKFICKKEVSGKRILLIDDIVTTGATVSECAKMLKGKGAKLVYVWSIT